MKTTSNRAYHSKICRDCQSGYHHCSMEWCKCPLPDCLRGTYAKPVRIIRSVIEFYGTPKVAVTKEVEKGIEVTK